MAGSRRLALKSSVISASVETIWSRSWTNSTTLSKPEDAPYDTGQVANERSGIFAQHHLLREQVRAALRLPPLFGLLFLIARSLGDAPGDQRTDGEGEHRHPLLRAGKDEGVNRRQEEVVERDCAQQRAIKRYEKACLG